ncbi:hypothetical protein BBJ29_007836 [Phytophthora kernoviae]|uniref:PHD-type domain-containing protein n=1 Tax=Phytophthora kernoviae TaxID=325452 RepID=A0A3R7JHE2_9STRA|nr:hypothetical protein BBJ29_007836 [Phytophthora kernoviae]
MRMTVQKRETNALRKYMAFHGIPEEPGSSQGQLAVTVARHFNEECKKADEGSSISSFVTFLTGTSDVTTATNRAKFRPIHRSKPNHELDKENDSRQVVVGEEMALAEEDVDDLFDDAQEAEAELQREHRSFVVKKRRPAMILNHEKRSRGNSGGYGADTSETGQKKKKRKGRLYCICKGASFGNMIACDNKKCLDRSNWYHMECVNLDTSEDPPETWYCPSCKENDPSDIPENQYRKPVASVTYGDMISHALAILPDGKGSFKEICDFVETEYESQLNWKLESDQRKSPVWKSSVRKILFSNVRFRKHPEDKGMFCLAA